MPLVKALVLAATAFVGAALLAPLRPPMVVAYTGGTPAHPWTVYVADEVHAALEDAVASVAR